LSVQGLLCTAGAGLVQQIAVHASVRQHVVNTAMLDLLLLLLLQAAADRSPSIESFAAAECMLALCDPSHFRQR
jgi:hypothetical protein